MKIPPQPEAGKRIEELVDQELKRYPKLTRPQAYLRVLQRNDSLYEEYAAAVCDPQRSM